MTRSSSACAAGAASNTDAAKSSETPARLFNARIPSPLDPATVRWCCRLALTKKLGGPGPWQLCGQCWGNCSSWLHLGQPRPRQPVLRLVCKLPDFALFPIGDGLRRTAKDGQSVRHHANPPPEKNPQHPPRPAGNGIDSEQPREYQREHQQVDVEPLDCR